MLAFSCYVEIRNRNDILVERLVNGDDLFLNFQWGYDRIGGCSDFILTTKHGFNSSPAYSGGYDVRYYVLNVTTGNYDLWFRGQIEQVKINLASIETAITTGRGYVIALSRLTKTETYTTSEISVIVKDVLDETVIPNTNITYDVGDIEATGFTPDSIKFSNTKVSEIFQTLADLAGTYEWGVGSDLKFFFKARSTTARFFTEAGINVAGFNWLTDYSKIVNRIQLEGGETGGSKYTRTLDDSTSQDKWGLREKVMQNAAITTNAVADQYGTSVLAEQKDPSQRGAMKLFRNLRDSNENTPIEDTIPLGTVEFRKKAVRFGEKKFGTFTFGGFIRLQIQNVKYSLADNGINVALTLGRPTPDLALMFKQIEFEISQTRQRST